MTGGERSQGSGTLLLLVVTLSIVGYVLLRYGGMTAVTDVAAHSRVAATVKHSHALTAEPKYNNGFGYSSFVAVLSMTTNVSIATLQLYVVPLLFAVPIFGAYVTFREILGHRRGLFAAQLGLIHPFFLFSAYRSTHEKFTYTFILVILYSLYVTYATDDASTKARFIIVGYLSTVGLVFLNVYFAITFIAVISFSLAFGVVASRYYGPRTQLYRLGYTLITSFGILMVIVLYFYPPAQHFLSGLNSMVTHTINLFSSASGTGQATSAGGTAPYRSVFTRWNSLGLYFFLVLYYIVVYPIAGLYWLVRVRSYLGKKTIGREQLPEVFLLIVFAAFSVVFAAAIVVDQTGLFTANMQLRIFPLVGFVAVILATKAVFAVLEYESSRGSGQRSRLLGAVSTNVLPILFVVLLVGFSVTGVVKATNEPAASTEWTVMTDDEAEAMRWAETNMRYEYLWSGYSIRLRSGYLIHHPRRGLQNRYDFNTIDIVVQYLVVSDVTRMQAESSELPLPPRDGASRIYTNGDTRLYWYSVPRPLDAYDEALRRGYSAS